MTSRNRRKLESLKCEVCKTYESYICGIKGFNSQWIEGSKRLQLGSAISPHAEREPHKKAMELFLKRRGLSLAERDACISLEENQQTILTGMSKMNKKDYERTKKKFDVAYFIAKEEMPMVKFESILSLEERHGVDIGTAYRNRNSGGIFVDSINNSLVDKLEKAQFYSILTDGPTDSSISENEAVLVVYFDVDEMTVKSSFLKLVFLEAGNAEGILEGIEAGNAKRILEGIEVGNAKGILEGIEAGNAKGILEGIDDAFKSIGIENFYEKLVGFGADGASVNRGDKEGVKTLLREKCPWLKFGTDWNLL